jgi:hypothetical protein
MCWTSTTVTCGHRIILTLSADVGIKSLQRQCLGRYLLGHCRGSLTASWQAACSTTSWFSGNCAINAASRCSSSYETAFLVSAQRGSNILPGRCQAVAESDISRRCNGQGGPNAWPPRSPMLTWWIFSCGDTWRSKFTQSLPEATKISRQDFNDLWQRSVPTR